MKPSSLPASAGSARSPSGRWPSARPLQSGLFAHFQSKEALQVETLERAAARFREAVSEPLRKVPDKSAACGFLQERWIAWLADSGLSGGCPILAAAIEFDDVPGPVHDAAARQFGELHELIRKLARGARRTAMRM